MLKIYCTECGNPTTYTSFKPKFCSACGQSFEKTINKPVNQKIISSQPNKILPKINPVLENENNDLEDDYDGDINYVPNINNLDVEIDKSTPTKTKLEILLGVQNLLQKEKE